MNDHFPACTDSTIAFSSVYGRGGQLLRKQSNKQYKNTKMLCQYLTKGKNYKKGINTVNSSSIQFQCNDVPIQHPVGQIQEQREVAKVQAWKTKHMK